MHSIQEKIIEIYKENNNSLPPFRTLAKTLGVASLNTVAYHINQLKKNGYLKETLNANGVMPLNLRNILNLSLKSGIYVILKNNTPLHIEETDDMKNSILKILANKQLAEQPLDTPLDTNALKTIEDELDKITVAYYFISNPEERKKIKEYVVGIFNKPR